VILPRPELRLSPLPAGVVRNPVFAGTHPIGRAENDPRPSWNQAAGTKAAGTKVGSAEFRTGQTGAWAMLKWALIFFIISIIAGAFGFTGISAGTAFIAKFLFFAALAIFVVFLVLALLAGEIVF
jgi:uncharacterized membrane protein YtjA (UPF0391 family)